MVAHASGQAPTADERALAPDLARGFMLLLIVVAHAPLYLGGLESGVRLHPAGGSLLDHLVRAATHLFVDSRAYPLFAALFGYGLATVAMRQLAAGVDQGGARRLLRRRGRWLVAFGLAHALLVTPIEILGAYGVAALLVAGLVLRPERTLLAVAAALLPVFAVMTAASEYVLSQPQAASTVGALGYSPVDLVVRLSSWLVAIVVNVAVVPVIVAVLLGAWAARRRLLEDPGPHRERMRRCMLGGFAVALLGAVPVVLADATGADLGWALASVHTLTGLPGGLAYALLFALLAQRLTGPGRRGVRLLAAAGKRSLTCYLLQSALLVAVLSDTFVGLGTRVHSAGAALAALVAWLGACAVAAGLEHHGRRGPADALLRRLVYRQAPAPRTAAGVAA